MPENSWLPQIRPRLPHEIHTAVFNWVLALIGDAGLVKGDRLSAALGVAPFA
jgi:hypothetical protein